MTLVYLLLGVSIVGVALTLVGLIRDARKVQSHDPAYWRKKGVL